MTFDMHLGSFVELHYVHGAHGFFDVGEVTMIWARNTWSIERSRAIYMINTVDVTTGFILKRIAKRVQKIARKRRHARLTKWMMRLGIILANKRKATLMRTTDSKKGITATR